MRRFLAFATSLLLSLSVQAATVLTPTPLQHFVDNNGIACYNCLLFTYAAGTNTKLATYTDATGATPNTDPITLNSRGEAPVWLTSGAAYKLVLAPAGSSDPPTSPIWTVDQITALAAGGAGSNAVVTANSAFVSGNVITGAANIGGIPAVQDSGLAISGISKSIAPQAYGASGSNQSTTGTINLGTNQLSVASAIDFQKGQGIFVIGAGGAYSGTAPSITVVSNGGTGTTRYYWVAAVGPLMSVSTAAGPVSSSGGTTLGTSLDLTGTAVYDAVTITGGADPSFLIYEGSTNVASAATCVMYGPAQFGTHTLNYYGPTHNQTCPAWAPATPPSTAQPQALETTISSIVGTAFTLATGASANATNAFVGHDDTAALQAAHTSGFPITYPCGNYNLLATIAPTTSAAIDGQACATLWGWGAFGPDFQFNVGTNNSTISHFQINDSNKVAGASYYINGPTNRIHIYDSTITNACDVLGGTAVVGLAVENFSVNKINCDYGVYLFGSTGSGSSVNVSYFTNIQLGTTTSAYCMLQDGDVFSTTTFGYTCQQGPDEFVTQNTQAGTTIGVYAGRYILLALNNCWGVCLEVDSLAAKTSMVFDRLYEQGVIGSGFAGFATTAGAVGAISVVNGSTVFGFDRACFSINGAYFFAGDGTTQAFTCSHTSHGVYDKVTLGANVLGATVHFAASGNLSASNPAFPATEACGVDILATFGGGMPLTGTTHTSTTMDGIANTAGIGNGWYIAGSGIPPNTTVSSFTSTTVTMSNAATSSTTASFSFEPPPIGYPQVVADTATPGMTAPVCDNTPADNGGSGGVVSINGLLNGLEVSHQPVTAASGTTLTAPTLITATGIGAYIWRSGIGSGAPFTDTTGTLAAFLTQFPGNYTGYPFKITYNNQTGSVATLAGGSNVTIAGTATTKVNQAHIFQCTFTGTFGSTPTGITCTG